MQGLSNRFRWVALNGLGVLIALLEITIAGFFFFDNGVPGFSLSTIAHSAMGITGFALLWAYVRERLDMEFYGCILLLIANLIDFWVSFTSSEVFPLRSATIEVVILIGVSLRAFALLRGGSFVMPPYPWRE